MSSDRSTPHVVVLGGGFAGLEAAKGLAGAPVRVTLVDRTNHHVFQPLLYQVATTVLSPGQITAPLRHVFRRAANVSVVLAEARGIDLDRRRVELDTGHLDYDYLLVATGARHAYFGHPEWERLAPGLKTVEDALEIRRRVLLAYEHAERRALLEPREGEARAPSFVVVGAGPTGVELAGALADIARRALERNFRAIDPARSRILLVEGADRVLPGYPDELSASARRQLEELGVEVRTGDLVTGIAPDEVRIGDETVAADVVLWATGVEASALGEDLGETDGAGRVPVRADLSLPGRPEVFVAGDLARFVPGAPGGASGVADEGSGFGVDSGAGVGDPLPALAAVALQQGKAVAAAIRADLAGRPRERFEYDDRGTMATIGRRRAVAALGRLRFTGLTAWLAWLLVHVILLIGFHNRLSVLREWVWAYFTRQRAARLITTRDVSGSRSPPVSGSPPSS